MLDTPGKNHTFNCALYQNVHFNIPTTTSFIQSSSSYIPDMNLTRKKKKLASSREQRPVVQQTFATITVTSQHSRIGA